MSDYKNKKYIYDENDKRLPVSQSMPVKFQLAQEELTYCVGCVESVVKCAVDVEHNLTDVQTSNILATLDGLSMNLDSQFKQYLEEGQRIIKERAELDKIRTEIITFNGKYGKWIKLGYGLVGGVVALVGSFIGLAI